MGDSLLPVGSEERYNALHPRAKCTEPCASPSGAEVWTWVWSYPECSRIWGLLCDPQSSLFQEKCTEAETGVSGRKKKEGSVRFISMPPDSQISWFDDWTTLLVKSYPPTSASLVDVKNYFSSLSFSFPIIEKKFFSLLIKVLYVILKFGKYRNIKYKV